MNHAEYSRCLEAIRLKVCPVCIGQAGDGTCDVSFQETCAIERFLPEIVETAMTVNSEKVDDYIAALRASVCRACRPNGELECSARSTADCALDRYFVLIIEAIEEIFLRNRPQQGTVSPLS